MRLILHHHCLYHYQAWQPPNENVIKRNLKTRRFPRTLIDEREKRAGAIIVQSAGAICLIGRPNLEMTLVRRAESILSLVIIFASDNAAGNDPISLFLPIGSH